LEPREALTIGRAHRALSASARIQQVSWFKERNETMHILWMLIIGLVIGALAKLIMPGRDPGGVIITMLLGVAGSLVAGLLGRSLGWYQAGESAGFIASIIGAIVLLALYRVVVGRRTLV
jgi:uncharacterized membrane protein YeaQ/YmgE (transglycosylase-associated protein family)